MSTPFPDQVKVLHLNTEQLSAMASMPCSEVFRAMSFQESSAIREIAREVNKSTASVGEHVARLLEVGLILPVGTRKRRAREETLYAHKANSNILDLNSFDAGILEAYVTKFRCDSRESIRLMTVFMQAIQEDPSLLDFAMEMSYVGYLTRDSAKKVKESIGETIRIFKESVENDPEVREKEEHVRVKLSMSLVPTQRESEARIKRKK